MRIMRIKFKRPKIKKLKLISKLGMILKKTSVFLIGGIVVISPWISRSFNFGLDLTENKIHSLSPVTKKIITSLKEPVTIKAFISQELPPQLSPLKNQLTWFLESYRQISPGKIKIEFLDPIKDQEAEKEARRYNLPPLEFSTLEKDKFQLSRGYLSVVVEKGEKNQPLIALQDLPNLEYHLTAAIKKVTQEGEKTIAFSVGHDETPLEEISLARKVIEQTYRWRFLDLGGDNPQFNDQFDLLIINGPQEEFNQEAKIILDQLIQRGKGIIFLLDQFLVGEELWVHHLNLNLEDLLSHYGLKIKKELIIDPSAALAGFRTDQGSFIIPYPYWPKITPEGLNQHSPVTASLETLTFPWVSPVEPDKGAEWLIKTSPRSWSLKEGFILTPGEKLTPGENKQEEKIIAAIQTNPQKSFYSPSPSSSQLRKLKIDQFINQGEKIKIALVGDADFIKNGHLVNQKENLTFLLNLIDFLIQEDDLISLRSKPVLSRPIKPLTEQEKQLVMAANFIFPVIFALSIWTGINFLRKRNLPYQS